MTDATEPAIATDTPTEAPTEEARPGPEAGGTAYPLEEAPPKEDPKGEEPPRLATVEELLASNHKPPIFETVTIGGQPVKIRNRPDGTAYMGVSLLINKYDGQTLMAGGMPMHMTPEIIMPLGYLSYGMVEPTATFLQVLEIAAATGMDCFNAGRRVMEISGVLDGEEEAEPLAEAPPVKRTGRMKSTGKKKPAPAGS